MSVRFSGFYIEDHGIVINLRAVRVSSKSRSSNPVNDPKVLVGVPQPSNTFLPNHIPSELVFLSQSISFIHPCVNTVSIILFLPNPDPS